MKDQRAIPSRTPDKKLKFGHTPVLCMGHLPFLCAPHAPALFLSVLHFAPIQVKFAESISYCSFVCCLSILLT